MAMRKPRTTNGIGSVGVGVGSVGVGATGVGIGIGVEGERLLGVLEGVVNALELLATLPTPETADSFNAFLLSAHDGDDRHCSELKPAVVETLADHFRLEASLAHQTSGRQQQRRASAVESHRKRTHNPRAVVVEECERPEVDDGYEEEEDEAEEEETPHEIEDGDQDNDDALRFPHSIHNVLQLLTHDKPTRDTLRRLSATHISPSVAALVHNLTNLIMLRERALTTSSDQADAQQRALRDASQRLVELLDDTEQLQFELAVERDARQTHSTTHVQMIAKLREQLSATQQRSSEALRASQRTHDHDVETLRTQYETDRGGHAEYTLTLTRMETRESETRKAEESDVRQRIARAGAELRELLTKYDAEMAALDERIEEATEEMREDASDVLRLATYFERVDEDRQVELVEQRAREAAAAFKSRRELNLFKFATRLQAIVRGFLARRQVRLDHELKKKKKKMKNEKNKKTKTKTKTKTRTTTKTTTKTKKKKKSVSNTTSSPHKPTRPSSASSTARRRPVSRV